MKYEIVYDKISDLDEDEIDLEELFEGSPEELEERISELRKQNCYNIGTCIIEE